MNKKNRTIWILALITLTVVYFSYLVNAGFPSDLINFSSIADHLVDMFKNSPIYKVFVGAARLSLLF